MAEQKQRASGTLPKNIRQIGTSIGSTRVYLEDYVYTYLHAQEVQETWTHRGFVLLGRVDKGKDYTRYFISGLIRVEDEYFKEQILEFNDETWTAVYKEMKQYYDNLEIVGWGQDVSNGSAGLLAELERNHKQNFNIQKNVLLLLDQAEKEEAFYIFEKNVMQRREGYYVYYEKNPQMQDYMIEKSNSRELNISPEEIQEPLVHSYRAALLEKKAQISERKWNGALYTTSLLLVLSVCVLGISTVNNVEKMQNLESTVNRISGQGGQAGLDVPAMSQNAKEGDSSDLNEAGRGQDTEKTENADGKGQEADDEPSGSGSQKTGLETSDSGKEESSETSGGENEAVGRETSGDDETEPTDTENSKKGTGEEASGSGKKEKSGSKTKASDSDNKNGKGEEPASSDSIDVESLSEAQTSLLQGYYIVKKGDSLVGISKKLYGTAAKAKKICQLNGIDDMDMIYAGQRLELP